MQSNSVDWDWLKKTTEIDTKHAPTSTSTRSRTRGVNDCHGAGSTESKQRKERLHVVREERGARANQIQSFTPATRSPRSVRNRGKLDLEVTQVLGNSGVYASALGRELVLQPLDFGVVDCSQIGRQCIALRLCVVAIAEYVQ